MRTTKLFLAAMAGLTALAAAPAQAQDYYLGQIILVANNFCPKGSLEARGTILSITSNQALFSLYGTTYGGNGTTTFAIPDLRGRAANGQGQGQGLQNYIQGEMAGVENTTLIITNLPSHTHAARMVAVAGSPNIDNPANASFADFPTSTSIYNNTAQPSTNMALMTVVTGISGGNSPVPIRSPYLSLRFCVVTSGIYPSQP